jgi:ABC-type sugar transport system permease subunit
LATVIAFGYSPAFMAVWNSFFDWAGGDARRFIGALQGFGLQLMLLGEQGGPDTRGMVPGLWMFNRAFIENQFGYACAIGLVIFAVILVLTFVNSRLVRTRT